jgi:hypothetical protein
MAEAPAEDAERSRPVAEAPCCLGRRDPLDEIGSKSLVLSLARMAGLGKEALFIRKRMWCLFDAIASCHII